LNDNEFPINTTTYPITRGMKVEIACTIVLFIFGVLSQFKIWKIVKERREKKDLERMKSNERRDQLEEAVGKELEDNNGRDLAHWEAVYGDKENAHPQMDSGVGSSIDSLPKRSTSVREREVDTMEMADMGKRSFKRSSKRTSRPIVTVRVASDEENKLSPGAGPSEENLLSKFDASRSGSKLSVYEDRKDESQDLSENETTSVKDWTRRSSAEQGPTVTPLPFSVPAEGETKEVDEDQQSVGTAGFSVLERRGMPLKQLSLRKKDEEDGFVLPHIDEDRASSVAATADEDVDMDALSAHRLSKMPSPCQVEFNKDSLIPFDVSDDEVSRSRSRSRSRSPRQSMIEFPVDEEDDEAIVRPVTAAPEPSEEAVSSSKRRSRKSTSASHRRSTTSRRSIRENLSDDEGESVSMVGSLKDHLPQKLSKVAMIYRTNEWAKHQPGAVEPETEEIPESASPGVRVDPVFAEEAAKSAETETKPAETAQSSRNTSQRSNNNPYRRSGQNSYQPASWTVSGSATPIYAFQHSGSQVSTQAKPYGAPASQLKLNTHASRNFSAPLTNQALVESPVDEDGFAPAPRQLHSAMGANLMDERNNRLKRKPTSTSFNALASSAALPPQSDVISPSDSASVRSARLDDDNISLSERKQLLDEEKMTLAQRKSLIQQQQQYAQKNMPANHQQAHRKATWPGPAQNTGRLSAHNNNPYGAVIYDSHQPKRNNTVDSVRQSNMLVQWRQSLQAEAQARQPIVVDENARMQMLAAQRQVEFFQQKEQFDRANRQSAIDVAMRTGHLHGVHRDAIRRMQAAANKQTPQ
jgi:hypothetical protein